MPLAACERSLPTEPPAPTLAAFGQTPVRSKSQRAMRKVEPVKLAPSASWSSLVLAEDQNDKRARFHLAHVGGTAFRVGVGHNFKFGRWQKDLLGLGVKGHRLCGQLCLHRIDEHIVVGRDLPDDAHYTLSAGLEDEFALGIEAASIDARANETSTHNFTRSRSKDC